MEECILKENNNLNKQTYSDLYYELEEEKFNKNIFY